MAELEEYIVAEIAFFEIAFFEGLSPFSYFVGFSPFFYNSI